LLQAPFRKQKIRRGFQLNEFAALGVLPAVVEKLAERAVCRPTAIQRLVMPPLLAGNSVVFRSATGTGKTFAYLVPAVQQLSGGDVSVSRYGGPALLVCAPTYELCSQIKAEIDFLAPSSAALLIGSVSLNRQIENLKKAKPLAAVGNPGRLLVLAKMGKLKFQGLRFLVLDEADRMTADDSRDETAELLRLIARNVACDAAHDAAHDALDRGVVVAACSATLAGKNRERLLPLLDGLCRANGAGGGPGALQIVESDEQEILRERIEHWAIFSESRRAAQTLRSFLAAAKPKKALVFTGRSDDAGKIAADLQYHHVNAAVLLGGTDKKARKEAVDGFRSGKIAVLVSSDLAARGLDIPNISHIIALDVPADGEAYIHRAGRTGRAGKRGVMVSIGDEDAMRRLASLEKKLKIVVYPKELYGGRVCGTDDGVVD
jgi:superfamily II DNA/RNA helicase